MRARHPASAEKDDLPSRATHVPPGRRAVTKVQSAGHLIRHSLRYVPRREREQVARDLKPIPTAVDAAPAALSAFDEKWCKRFRRSRPRGHFPNEDAPAS